MGYGSSCKGKKTTGQGIENQVKLICSRVYARLRHMQFFDLRSLNLAIAERIKVHNQTRMQQKPWCREEKFLAEEKKLLLPLPGERFEMKTYNELQVGKNNHIYLSENKHYYSVPYRLIGTKVKVIYTRGMVYIFSKGKQIAVHIRSYQQGGYTSVNGHLCSQHQHYRDRSPQYYLRMAEDKSALLSKLMALIFTQNNTLSNFIRPAMACLAYKEKQIRTSLTKPVKWP